MKSKKEFWLLVLLPAAILFAQGANAVPVPTGWTSRVSHPETFSIGGGTADVLCNVYSGYTSGDYANRYVYTYQITNSSDVGISFFSVELLDSAGADSENYDNTTGDVDPAYWGIVTSSESVNASFAGVIDNGQASVLLWVASDYGHTYGGGALFGFNSVVPSFATVTADPGSSIGLLTPVPEPATVVLLGIGGLMTLSRKGKSA